MELTQEQKRMIEDEANQFAMSLLVPDKLLKQVIDEYGDIDLCDDKFLKYIARTFDVSMNVAAIRVSQIGVFNQYRK